MKEILFSARFKKSFVHWETLFGIFIFMTGTSWYINETLSELRRV